MASETPDMFMLQDMAKHMSLAQWRVFLCALAQVVTAGYGSVTLEVVKGQVRRVVPAPSIDLPCPSDDIEKEP